MKRVLIWVAFAILALAAAGCGSQELAVKDAWARPAAAGDNSAVYFTIDNPTSQADTLLSASYAGAAATELHRSMMKDDGTMSMAPQPSVEIPARSKVAFEPGGLHVMLVGVTGGLQVNDEIQVNLTFQNAGAVTVSAKVREP